MRCRAIALRSERPLTGLGPEVGDQLRRRFGREGRLDDEHIRHRAEHNYRLELRGFEGELPIEVVIDRDRAWRACKQHVTVRRRARHRLGPDIASRARAVLDDHGLAPTLAQPVRDDPRQGISGAASGKWHDHPHKARWIGVLSLSRDARGQPHQGPREDWPEYDLRPALRSCATRAVRFPHQLPSRTLISDRPEATKASA